VIEQIRARLAAVDGADLVLVAIDGPGRVQADLVAALQPDVVLRMEDFPRDGRCDDLDAQEAYELCFDWGRLVEEVLDPIAVGQAGQYTVDGGPPVDVPAHGLVVVDGPFSTRPQLRGYYDLMVWVDGPTPTGRPAEDWYAANVGPPSDALVLSADR
jgi:hypothetical protein